MISETPSLLQLRTPPRRRSQKTSNPSRLSSYSSYRTPVKTPSRCRRPRMSPSPRLLKSTSPSSSSSCFGSVPTTSRGDRFIPSRRQMNVDLCRRALLYDDENSTQNDTKRSNSYKSDTPIQKEFKRQMLSALCNVPSESLNEEARPRGILSFNLEEKGKTHCNNSEMNKNCDPYSCDVLHVLQDVKIPRALRQTPGRAEAQLQTDKPTRLLDAPGVRPDFYANVISWSKANILAVALFRDVYLWNGHTHETQHLMSLSSYHTTVVTSIEWCPMRESCNYIAIGTSNGFVEIWDTIGMTRLRTLRGHASTVDTLAWNEQCLTSGGADCMIYQHDLRSRNNLVAAYQGHEGRICGLKWNEGGSTLASGGNDDGVCIWDAAMSSRPNRQQQQLQLQQRVAPRLVLKEHTAAIKALDWSPFRPTVLASGGGKNDGTIKLWNTNSGAMLNSIDTGAQVTSLLWSRNRPELCSSHGYNECPSAHSANKLIMWNCKNDSLDMVKTFVHHKERVLGLASGPDGTTVASLSADETLAFWNIFTPGRQEFYSLLTRPTFGMPTIR